MSRHLPSYKWFYIRNIFKPISNQSLFKLIISGQTLINWNKILSIYAHFNGQTFSGAFEQFSFTAKFLGLKCKNRKYLENIWSSCFQTISLRTWGSDTYCLGPIVPWHGAMTFDISDHWIIWNCLNMSFLNKSGSRFKNNLLLMSYLFISTK